MQGLQKRFTDTSIYQILAISLPQMEQQPPIGLTD
jgi:hypothetical protein